MIFLYKLLFYWRFFLIFIFDYCFVNYKKNLFVNNSEINKLTKNELKIIPHILIQNMRYIKSY